LLDMYRHGLGQHWREISNKIIDAEGSEVSALPENTQVASHESSVIASSRLDARANGRKATSNHRSVSLQATEAQIGDRLQDVYLPINSTPGSSRKRRAEAAERSPLRLERDCGREDVNWRPSRYTCDDLGSPG